MNHTRNAFFIFACLVFAGTVLVNRHPHSPITEAAYNAQFDGSRLSTNVVDAR